MILIIFILFYIPSSFVHASDLVGIVSTYQIQEKETLYDIAREFDLGIDELRYANPGVDVWIPEKSESLIIIPNQYILPSKPHEDIVINRAELRLYLFSKKGDFINSFPVSLGTSQYQTPIGNAKIIDKQQNPYWIVPFSIQAENPHLSKIIPPGIDNPLGKYALYLTWR